MQGTVFFHALALVCASASVVFATTEPEARRLRYLAMAAGFALTLSIVAGRVPSTTGVAAAIAGVAALVLTRSSAGLIGSPPPVQRPRCG
jgi:hypothetical protein